MKKYNIYIYKRTNFIRSLVIFSLIIALLISILIFLHHLNPNQLLYILPILPLSASIVISSYIKIGWNLLGKKEILINDTGVTIGEESLLWSDIISAYYSDGNFSNYTGFKLKTKQGHSIEIPDHNPTLEKYLNSKLKTSPEPKHHFSHKRWISKDHNNHTNVDNNDIVNDPLNQYISKKYVAILVSGAILTILAFAVRLILLPAPFY